MMAEKDIAIDFLNQFLPEEVSALIDYDSLELQSNSFLDEELQEVFADTVFRCRMKESQKADLYLSVLIEHKSYPDKYAAIQILNYLTKAYLAQLKSGESTLYPVIPLLFYQGEQEWQYRPLLQLIEGLSEELNKFIPDFTTIFVDLVRKSETELEDIENIFLLSALYIQKFRMDKALFEKLEKIMSKFDSVRHRKRNFSNSIIVYLFDITSITKEELIILIARFPEQIKTEIMTTFEIAEQRGIEKGIEKGMQKGIEQNKVEIILKGYQKGASIEFLADITGLSAERVKEIIAQNVGS